VEAEKQWGGGCAYALSGITIATRGRRWWVVGWHQNWGGRGDWRVGVLTTVRSSDGLKFDSNSNSNGFKQIQTVSKFDRPKRDLPKIKKIEIKYSCEGFEERNIFLHRNFFKFEINFELKFWEAKVYF
jgi:hypothetical protein